MRNYLETEIKDLQRQRRERIIIACLAVAVVILSFLGFKAFDLGLDLPVSGSILVFALIDVNIILFLLLLYLIVRNLVKLVFERKKKILGTKLRTKLVIAFMALSLLPTIILFFISVQAINTSIEYWYNLPIEKSLYNSVDVGQDYYQNINEGLGTFGNNISRLISYNGYMLAVRSDELEKFINEKRNEYGLTSVKIFSDSFEEKASAQDDRIDLSLFKEQGKNVLEECMKEGTDAYNTQSSIHGDLVTGLVPIFSRTESRAVIGLVSLSKFIPETSINKLQGMAKGLEEYKQFNMLKGMMKVSYLIILSIVSLLIIFSSVWFGLFISRGITVPIQELAEGTERVASGDYDFSIDLEAQDEIGVLVNSFNRMTLDLKNGKKQLEETNTELVKSNLEMEQRRRYMEIVLANISTGVLSADLSGNILTINKSAEAILNIKAGDTIGKNYKDVMGKDQLEAINSLFEDRKLLKKGFIQKQLAFAVGEENLNLLVSMNILNDEQGKHYGFVAVFEDLTEIEKAQRISAWREVARRIAHEVKNPLTPIQLSAQRLKKRYGNSLGHEDKKILEECTDMIIDQAEGLKRLVNEFSNYARMPMSNPMPEEIGPVLKEAVGLYQETKTNIKVAYRESNNIPIIKIDREQIKRMMINLLDNAVSAIEDKGEISVELSYAEDQDAVRIEVADNGRGISPEHKVRLFEPYFSTKKHGTGLGLAIVNSIVQDHKGYIEVQDNMPRGSRFIIELPVSA
jgi:two-component system, NtrC family, nitrogen regulation sensor histidine kinase NtrY